MYCYMVNWGYNCILDELGKHETHAPVFVLSRHSTLFVFAFYLRTDVRRFSADYTIIESVDYSECGSVTTAT